MPLAIGSGNSYLTLRVMCVWRVEGRGGDGKRMGGGRGVIVDGGGGSN